ncbi:hypothetical protein IA74_010435 [Bacteroides fragilis]|uniref:Uncharacterized protein n=1 Tax=Bacteroides fragilis TaxID=817 RepID=A0AAP9D1A1_BACFG|nr:hypothetical protein IA74_010435 [Bacteroides fragilis]
MNLKHSVQIILYHYELGEGKNKKMRKLYFSTDTKLNYFHKSTLAQLLSHATIYFRVGYLTQFRK